MVGGRYRDVINGRGNGRITDVMHGPGVQWRPTTHPDMTMPYYGRSRPVTPTRLPMLQRSLAALVLASVLGACALHMDRLVPPSASSFDAALLGTWISEKGDTAVVTRRGANEYDILFVEKGEPLALRASRGEVAGHTVLELRLAASDDIEGWPTAKMLLVVRVHGDSVTTQIISKAALRAALGSEQGARFFEQDESVILAGDRQEMHAILERHLGTAGMLEPAQAWRRAPR